MHCLHSSDFFNAAANARAMVVSWCDFLEIGFEVAAKSLLRDVFVPALGFHVFSSLRLPLSGRCV